MIIIEWYYKITLIKTELTNISFTIKGLDKIHKQIKQGLYLPPKNWDKYKLTKSIR